MKTINEKDKIVFNNVSLDEIVIKGEDIDLEKIIIETPSFLEINVHDSIVGTSVGPGQKN